MAIPSQVLINRLKHSEGYSAVPYLCPAGRVTIGYGWNLEANPAPIRPLSPALYQEVRRGGIRGHVLLKALVELEMAWDKETADSFLREEVDALAASLVRQCPAFNLLLNHADHAGEARAEVLIDMAYNLGLRGLLKFKKMLGAVEMGDYRQAAEEMLHSAWAVQVKSRATELARVMREGNL